MVTGLDPATGLYEQFAGFHALQPLELAVYADRKVPIDVVIGRELTQRSQVVKQADVVALIALLPEEFPGAMAETKFFHYEPRCAHGSSRSAGMHALVAARLGDAAMALRYLTETGPPISTSIRTAPVAYDRRSGRAVAGGNPGLRRPRPESRHAWDRPEASAALAEPAFRVCWRGRSVAIRIAGSSVQATLAEGEAMELRIASARQKLMPGETVDVAV